MKIRYEHVFDNIVCTFICYLTILDVLVFDNVYEHVFDNFV